MIGLNLYHLTCARASVDPYSQVLPIRGLSILVHRTIEFSIPFSCRCRLGTNESILSTCYTKKCTVHVSHVIQ